MLLRPHFGRSQMAAGYLRSLYGDAIHARCAGSSPGQTINPVAVEAMTEEGTDITGRRPQCVTPDLMQQAVHRVSDARSSGAIRMSDTRGRTRGAR